MEMMMMMGHVGDGVLELIGKLATNIYTACPDDRRHGWRKVGLGWSPGGPVSSTLTQVLVDLQRIVLIN